MRVGFLLCMPHHCRMLDAQALLFVDGLGVGFVAGGVGGVLAALAGVGGGLVYVPLFYALTPGGGDGMSAPVLASMLAIMLTGGLSARSHYRLGHVDLAISLRLLPGLILGVAFGLWSTLHIDESWILLGLAALDAWVAFDYGRGIRLSHRPAAAWRRIVLSVPIGYISGLFGIAGGTMLVPLLRRSLPLRIAVGTSAFCGAWMVVCGVILNLRFEQAWLGILQAQGAFLAGALFGILILLPKASAWGAGLHERLDEASLRLILKALFLGLACVLALAASVKLL